MERVKIKADIRDKTGKGACKEFRSKGLIPAVVYGEGANMVINIAPASFKMLKSVNFSENTIIDMEINGDNGSSAIPILIKEVQYHALTDVVIHIDFLKVSLKEKIKVHIPIVLQGEAKGTKEGGELEQILRELEVEGLPLSIPRKIEVDITELAIGHSLHVSDLNVPEGLKVISFPETAVATVIMHKEEKDEEAEEEEPSGEPEVIKAKKEEPVKDSKK